MKRIAVLLLSILLVLSLCACAGQNKAVRCARECWNDVDSDGKDAYEIYFMEYTSRKCLNDKTLETSMYDEIPRRGCVVLFKVDSNRYACFLSSDGEVEFIFDYRENKELSDKYWKDFQRNNNLQSGEKSLEYMKNCTYIYGMFNGAFDGQELKNKIEENIWYSFSKRQIENIVD